eukprot:TRINITY_DN6123_c0_g1_i3.p1 TRINITY_DN6123_c0_g1~~TRINITY_DN6123_c0_g1_i3.p1  ORF type:complete len:183 (-),score=39.09 TRINITY_DN6123_c0_g1_i3:139-612(-)
MAPLRQLVALVCAAGALPTEASLRQLPAADQPVWQAAEPAIVNVDFDVPQHRAAYAMKKTSVKEASSGSFLASSVLPQVPLADQPVWQASEPVTVNVDFDVPTHGVADVMKSLKKDASSASLLASSRRMQAVPVSWRLSCCHKLRWQTNLSGRHQSQ